MGKQKQEGNTLSLIEKINKKEAVIGIIGMGYVGLPLVLKYGQAGFKVMGFDVDPVKVKKLNTGKSYIKHIPSAGIKELIKKKAFRATTDFKELKKVDAISICVPTPLDNNREPDLSYINATATEIAKYLRKDQLVVLESTTYPGTTRELLLPPFEATGLKLGKDYYLAYAPEREDPGNPTFTISDIPRVVGGMTPACTKVATAMYSSIIANVITVSCPEAAELTKLLENIFRCVNIAMVNEMKMLCDRMGLDIWEVIAASSTKPFGFMPFYPGPGLGGHCIPIDPFYLTWKARDYEFSTRFIELAGDINIGMPRYVIQRVMEELNEAKKSLKGAKVLVLGAAYKKDVDDIRESPSIKVIELLLEKGANVNYNDPFIPKFPNMRHSKLRLKSVPISPAAIKKYDMVIIVTDHTAYDYQMIVDNANILLDTRNATKDVKRNRKKIKKA
jgi:UDP-N-acetyl-D-glucosamine dehydrogenase